MLVPGHHPKTPGRLGHAVSLAMLCAILAGCGPAAAPTDGLQPGQAEPAVQKTLVLISYGQPPGFDTKLTHASGEGSGTGARDPFIQTTTQRDAKGVLIPVLVDSLPALNTDSWKVFPDGKMETIFTLRSNATWHDGTPLTAHDYVFAFRLYASPDSGAGPSPQNLMEDLVAVDDRTMVWRWKQLTPRAGTGNIPPLPRHILEQTYTAGGPQAILAHSWNTDDYVGLGPYRLTRWERGAFMEGAAFESYVLGRPRIDKVQVMIAGSRDTVLAMLLGGGAHGTTSGEAMGIAQAQVLKREWERGAAGSVIGNTEQIRYMQIQFHPEVGVKALHDLRVRKALAHVLDRPAIADGALDGEGVATQIMFDPMHVLFAEADRTLTKYPFDQRRADQLLAEAGFSRQGDGSYGNTDGALDLQILSDNEREGVILVDQLQRAGLKSQLRYLTPALATDRELQSRYPALSIRRNGFGTYGFFSHYSSDRIPNPPNWVGANRGNYRNPEMDRLSRLQDSTLDESEVQRIDVAIGKLISEDVPAIPLFYQQLFTAAASQLKGPGAYHVESIFLNNLHEWEWR